MVDGFEALVGRDVRRMPESGRTRSDLGGREVHVSCQHIGKPANLAPRPIALGLAGERKTAPFRGLPMRPVARWQLMIALTLSVPCADWFTPCE